MSSVTWNMDSVTLGTQNFSKYIDGQEVSLEVTTKRKCTYCKREKTGTSTYCCGYSNTMSYSHTLKLQLSRNTSIPSDLQKSLFNPDISDFVFLVDGEEIPVSRAILSARSPVFCKLFTSDFKEKSENKLKLELNFSKEAFKETIRFIYTGKVTDLDNNVFGLLHAADYYQIDSLKLFCENKLHEILNENNANKIFQNAHLFNASEKLKQASFDIIKGMLKKMNIDLAEKFSKNPSQVDKIMILKAAFENALL